MSHSAPTNSALSQRDTRRMRDAFPFAYGRQTTWADLEDCEIEDAVLAADRARDSKAFRTARKMARRSREFTFDDSTTR